MPDTFGQIDDIYMPGKPGSNTGQFLYQKPETIIPLSHITVTQAVTPQYDSNSRYSNARCVPHEVQDQVLEFNFQFAETAFFEDKTMLEAQQEVIRENPGNKLKATSHDRVGNHFSKLVSEAANA